MPYCPRCGVEVDSSIRSCPLCSTSIPSFEDLGPGEPAWPSPFNRNEPLDPSKTYASSAETRRQVFLVLAAILFTAALAVVSTDLITTGSVSWSRWPLASLLSTLALTGAALAWYRKPLLWGGAWTLVSVGFLAVLDLCDDRSLEWFPTLGLPLTLTTFFLIFLGAVIVRNSRRLGFNLFGLIASLAALELAAIDALITAWTTKMPELGWSTVTSLVLIPLALFFFFLHATLRRTPDLKRIFHF